MFIIRITLFWAILTAVILCIIAAVTAYYFIGLLNLFHAMRPEEKEYQPKEHLLDQSKTETDGR